VEQWPGPGHPGGDTGAAASGPAFQCSTGPRGQPTPAPGGPRRWLDGDRGAFPDTHLGQPSISIEEHDLISLSSGSHDRKATLDGYGVSPEALMARTTLETGQHYPGKHISPKARAIYFLSLLFYVSTIFAELMPRPLARPSANPLREAWQPVYLMDITTS
jgi:hypothetical protein